jgi:hypothetical protein
MGKCQIRSKTGQRARNNLNPADLPDRVCGPLDVFKQHPTVNGHIYLRCGSHGIFTSVDMLRNARYICFSQRLSLSASAQLTVVVALQGRESSTWAGRDYCLFGAMPCAMRILHILRKDGTKR